MLNTELSQRESEVYKLMLEGKGVKEVAKLLFVEPTTAHTHFLNIYRKKNVNSQKELLVNRIRELERCKDKRYLFKSR